MYCNPTFSGEGRCDKLEYMVGCFLCIDVTYNTVILQNEQIIIDKLKPFFEKHFGISTIFLSKKED